ncbi:MAG TPA: putative peptidoglycan glycosyltransferase FtsW [bacterium]|nr:putative peptidoglycan glycosyltransferase FtsW [bacterium]
MTSGFAMDRPLRRIGGDPALLGSLLLILGIGLAGLYSASYGFALSLGKAPSYFVNRQLLWVVPSLLAFGLGAFISLDRLSRQMSVIVLGTMFLLVLPFVPVIGITKNGASRWFGFAGQMFQPSELFKPVLVLYLAHILSKKAERLSDVVNGVFPPLLVVAAGVAIVLMQNDFSTALLLGILGIIMFWIAEVPLVFFVALASVGLPLVSLSVLTSDYRLKRVLGFIAPAYDPADLSYQVNGSIRAIAAGGLWGKGLGQGTLKIRSIPEVQSDFVFAAWAEETGFVGVLVFAALWAFFLWRAFKTAFEAPDAFRRHLAFGLACYLAIQTLINIMVVSGAAPATGIPLPFFSSGGSSLISVSLTAGLLYNVSRSVGQEPGHERAATDV